MTGAPPPSSRITVTAVLAMVACAGVAVGFYLPWFGMSVDVRQATGVTQAQLDRYIEESKADARVAGVCRRVAAGDLLSGTEWVTFFEWALSREGSFQPEEARALRLVLAVLKGLPWFAAALAAWALLHRLRAMPSPLLALLILLGLAFGVTGGLLWVGASVQAKEELQANPLLFGMGLRVVTCGGLLALLCGIFGVRLRNLLPTYLLALLLAASGGVAAYWMIHG